MLAVGVARVDAQGASALDPSTMRPTLDGDPRSPPGIRKSLGDSLDLKLNRIGDAADLAGGAGGTGFNSSNTRRQKGKGAPKSKTSAGTPPVVEPLPFEQRQNRNQGQNQNPVQNQSQNPPQQRRPFRPGSAYLLPTVTGPEALNPVAEPLKPGERAAEGDAFVPTGIQVGSFNLRPGLDLTGALDSNPARSSTPRPSWYSVIAPELLINSNWARHELKASLRGTYTSYENRSDLNRPDMDAKVNGRIDVGSDTRADLEGRVLIGTDSPGSPDIQANLAKLPIFTTFGGSVGLAQRFNRFQVAAKASTDRTVYEDSHFVDGQVSSNDDRNFNRHALELRTSYELTPGVRPFVDLTADTRVHDVEVDKTGMRRDSEGLLIRGGTTFEVSRQLIGDAAVGWVTRTYKDPLLPDIEGMTFDSSLTWLASGLTTVKLTARTTVDESTVVGVSGVFRRDVGIAVDHAFRRWLLATLRFTAGVDEYVGSDRKDNRYLLSGLLTYKLSRELQLKAEYRHEWLNSSVTGASFAADVVLFGVRLQR
jgi:hypothetical protein